MAEQVAAFARQQRSNVVGGCCGAGPHHLRAITDNVAGLARPSSGARPSLRVPSDTNNGGHFDRALYPPGVVIPSRRPRFLLSGTEELVWSEGAVECCRIVMPRLADLQGPGWRASGERAALTRLRAAVREEGIGCLGLEFCMHRRGQQAGAWSDADVVRFANLVQGRATPRGFAFALFRSDAR
eukprot:522981-Rhodomonas_salina.2